MNTLSPFQTRKQRKFVPVSFSGLTERRPWRWYALRWGGGIVLVTLFVVPHRVVVSGSLDWQPPSLSL